jgi:hypothetical protein
MLGVAFFRMRERLFWQKDALVAVEPMPASLTKETMLLWHLSKHGEMYTLGHTFVGIHAAGCALPACARSAPQSMRLYRGGRYPQNQSLGGDTVARAEDYPGARSPPTPFVPMAKPSGREEGQRRVLFNLMKHSRTTWGTIPT